GPAGGLQGSILRLLLHRFVPAALRFVCCVSRREPNYSKGFVGLQIFFRVLGTQRLAEFP
ncbi:hypothetical protein, partial [Noviherbaspirillum aerium]|uniref:hypothetical protein n=1 Tax=Noviherbaspirillum aerium TaxID=2588497 RepID=UPI001CEF9A84